MRDADGASPMTNDAYCMMEQKRSRETLIGTRFKVKVLEQGDRALVKQRHAIPRTEA